ncbi:bZIP transcription factor [Paraphaeosphaeria sporulosa]
MARTTPPIEIFPAELRRDSFLEDSLPVQQPQNKPLRLDDRNVQAFQNYQSQQPGSQQLSYQDSPVRASKRRRTSRPASADQSPPSPLTSQQTDNPSPQPPKRKRGRPKSRPQLVEACTADGFLVRVSSTRRSHLEKNRVVAYKCRMHKKEYINGLESRAREHSNKNKLLKENISLLREEILKLKSEVLRHAGCGFGPVEEYLARCVDDLLDNKAATGIPGSGKRSRTQSPVISTISPSAFLRRPSDLPPKWIDREYQEDHSWFDLLEDIEVKTGSPNI